MRTTGVRLLTVLLFALLCVPFSISGAYADIGDTIYVSTYGNDTNDGLTPETAKFTIQEGISTADSGGTVLVAPGTYPEEVDLTEPINLIGAGSDSVLIDGCMTVITAGTEEHPIIISGFTISYSDDDGLTIVGDEVHDLYFYDVASSHNDWSGVAFETIQSSSITFENCHFYDNGRFGMYVDITVSVNKLNIISTTIENNGVCGFGFNPDYDPAIATTGMDSITIHNCTFIDNGDSSLTQSTTGYGDISFVAYNGDAWITNTTIDNEAEAHIGIMIRGKDTTAPIGNFVIDSVTVNGNYIRPDSTLVDPRGRGYGILIENYSDLSALSITNVEVNLNSNSSAIAFSGLADTLVLDTTNTFNAPDGIHIETVPSEKNNSDYMIDARYCTLGSSTAADATTYTERFDLSNTIYDLLDEYTQGAKRGYVKLFESNFFVTKENNADVQFQPALDIAQPNDTVHVRRGVYAKQTADDRYVFGTDGPHTFGLFLATDSVALIGHRTLNDELPSNADAKVAFNTGADGGIPAIFVQANHVTLAGLDIRDNYDVDFDIVNSFTVGIVGNDARLHYNTLEPAKGIVVVMEWDSTTYDENLVQSYSIYNNALVNVGIMVTNGAGVAGDRSTRVIQNNVFAGDPGSPMRASILFQGWNGIDPVADTVTLPVGGAYISNNVFDQTTKHAVKAAGNEGGYIESEIDFGEIWDENNFVRRAVALVSLTPFEVQTYTDNDGYDNTRSIDYTISFGTTIVQSNDTLLVGPGVYDENPALFNNTVAVRNDSGASFAPGGYFVFGTTGLGDANFLNWPDSTFNNLGVRTNGSLQEAANYVNPFGTLHMAGGTYNLSSTVTLDSGITVRGPEVSSDCNFMPDAIVACTSNVRTFDIAGTSPVSVYGLELNIGTGANNRFFRVTSSGNVNTSYISYKRNGVRLFGMNHNGVQPDRDIPKFIDDGYDIGFGTGKVNFGDRAPMIASTVAAGWKGDDGNAAQIGTVVDYSGNGLTLSQATLTRKPTRAVVDSNYVITAGVTKFIAANVNSTVHGGSERSVFVAFKTPASSTAAIVYKHGDQTNGVSVWTNTSNQAGIDLIIGGTSHSMLDTTTPNTWYIAQVYFNGNDATHRAGMTIAGVATPEEYYWDSSQIAATSLTTPSGSNAVISLGARQGYTTRNGTVLNANTLGDAFTGSIGEVLILNSSTSTSRNSAYCMLQSKWNAGSTSNELEKDDPSVIAGDIEPSILTYPNPTTDYVNIDIVPAATENVRISIVNTMGVEVANIFNGMVNAGSILPLNFDVLGLSSGAYMILVAGDATHMSMPFMVQR